MQAYCPHAGLLPTRDSRCNDCTVGPPSPFTPLQCMPTRPNTPSSAPSTHEPTLRRDIRADGRASAGAPCAVGCRGGQGGPEPTGVCRSAARHNSNCVALTILVPCAFMNTTTQNGTSHSTSAKDNHDEMKHAMRLVCVRTLRASNGHSLRKGLGLPEKEREIVPGQQGCKLPGMGHQKQRAYVYTSPAWGVRVLENGYYASPPPPSSTPPPPTTLTRTKATTHVAVRRNTKHTTNESQGHQAHERKRLPHLGPNPGVVVVQEAQLRRGQQGSVHQLGLDWGAREDLKVQKPDGVGVGVQCPLNQSFPNSPILSPSQTLSCTQGYPVLL